MTDRIFKYPLPVRTPAEVSMPEGAKVLCVDVQYGEVMLWARVDENAPEEVRRFRTVPTGQPIPEEAGRYLGTVILVRGSIVLHIFEEAQS